MIFLAQNNVVDKNAGEDDIVLQRIDTVSGSVVPMSSPASLSSRPARCCSRRAFRLATPPTLPARWSLSWVSSAEALFGAGLVGASFLAACVLPGITSSAICEAFGWERGADRSWQEAPVYRGIITAIIFISAGLVIVPGVDLFQIMMTSQVINGVLLPVVLVFQVVIAATATLWALTATAACGTCSLGRLSA